MKLGLKYILDILLFWTIVSKNFKDYFQRLKIKKSKNNCLVWIVSFKNNKFNKNLKKILRVLLDKKFEIKKIDEKMKILVLWVLMYLL